MPAKTDQRWFHEKFQQLAYELEEARRQEVKPHHLMIRATRASIQAARLVIGGVNAGVFNRCPRLRENLRFAWTGKIEGSTGTVTVDEQGRCHIQLIADVPEAVGGPLPVETASDEQLARLWVFPIFPVVKTLQPSSFKANAGAYDWKTIRKDVQGSILGRDGKPLKYERETMADPDTGEPVYTWRRSGEPAYVGDDYDDADSVWHSRAGVGDWADTCRALADLIAESETEVNRDKGVSPSLQFPSKALQELTAILLASGSLRERGLHRSFDVANGCVATCFTALRAPGDPSAAAGVKEIPPYREYALQEGQAGESPSGDGNDQTQGQKPTKQRMKRQVAEPLIGEYLMQRPHDTAGEVAKKVGCSVGVVAESSAWKLNQQRLKIAKQQGIDPKAVKLDERAVNAVGGGKIRQLHDSRQQADGIVDEIDQREQELFRQIGEYQNDHPAETPEQVARALGCKAGDVESQQATLNRLISEQAEDQKEDIAVDDPNTKRGTRQKWVRKQV